MAKTFNYISGPSHGWLSVSHKDIPDSIKDNISQYSYMTFDRVYLEEDRDMPMFMDAYGLDSDAVNSKHVENEYIRSYGSYKPRYLKIKVGDTVTLWNGEEVFIEQKRKSSLMLRRKNGHYYKISKNKIMDYLK